MIDTTKPMRLAVTHEPVTYVTSDGHGFKVRIPSDTIGRWFKFDGTRGHPEGRSSKQHLVVENIPMIDVTKPLEAVRTRDGKVVPLTFHKLNPNGKDQFFTTDSPCSTTSNDCWYLDGRDRCHRNEWTIRNVATVSMPLDLTRPMQMRDGTKVTLLSSGAAGINPLVFQCEGSDIVFARPLDGRALPDQDLPIDVVNPNVETTQFMTFSLKTHTCEIWDRTDPNQIRLADEGVLLEVKRLNGKLMNITFVRAGPNA